MPPSRPMEALTRRERWELWLALRRSRAPLLFSLAWIGAAASAALIAALGVAILVPNTGLATTALVIFACGAVTGAGLFVDQLERLPFRLRASGKPHQARSLARSIASASHDPKVIGSLRLLAAEISMGLREFEQTKADLAALSDLEETGALPAVSASLLQVQRSLLAASTQQWEDATVFAQAALASPACPTNLEPTLQLLLGIGRLDAEDLRLVLEEAEVGLAAPGPQTCTDLLLWGKAAIRQLRFQTFEELGPRFDPTSFVHDPAISFEIGSLLGDATASQLEGFTAPLLSSLADHPRLSNWRIHWHDFPRALIQGDLDEVRTHLETMNPGDQLGEHLERRISYATLALLEGDQGRAANLIDQGSPESAEHGVYLTHYLVSYLHMAGQERVAYNLSQLVLERSEHWPLATRAGVLECAARGAAGVGRNQESLRYSQSAADELRPGSQNHAGQIANSLLRRYNLAEDPSELLQEVGPLLERYPWNSSLLWTKLVLEVGSEGSAENLRIPLRLYDEVEPHHIVPRARANQLLYLARAHAILGQTKQGKRRFEQLLEAPHVDEVLDHARAHLPSSWFEDPSPQT